LEETRSPVILDSLVAAQTQNNATPNAELTVSV